MGRRGTFVDDPLTRRKHEASSHLCRHQEHEHPQRAGRPPRQADRPVQRALHPDRDLCLSGWPRQRLEAGRRTRRQSPLRTRLEIVGSPGAHRTAHHRESALDAAVTETDALLVGGGDPLYLAYWIQESGLVELLPSLGETVWVGVSAGSLVMGPHVGEEFIYG